MADLHTAIVELLRLKAHRDLIYFRAANGGPQSPIVAAKLKKRMGVVAGVPDLAFVLPDGRAAFLEVKTRTGRLSPEQVAFRDRCNAVGAPYAMARSFVEEAERVLAAWRGLRLPMRAGEDGGPVQIERVIREIVHAEPRQAENQNEVETLS